MSLKHTTSSDPTPTNGKSGIPRTVVPDDKYLSIDWTNKRSDVTINYPNRRLTKWKLVVLMK